MPASDYELHFAFLELIGTDEAQEVYRGHVAEGWEEWAVLFSETGVDYESEEDTIEAFREFLLAFYPQEGMSGDQWETLRDEFYREHDLTDHQIDWEAYREAIGYGR